MGFIGGSSAWSPLLLGSKLAAWWNADDVAGADASSATTWTDKKGSLALTEATTPPVVSASGVNGFRGISFNGTTQFLTGVTTGLPTGATAGRILTLGKFTTGVTMCTLGYGNGTASQQRKIVIAANGTPQASDGTASVSGTSGSVANNSVHLIEGSWPGGTVMNGYLDATAFSGNPATISTLATSTTRTRLGSASGTSATQFLNGILRHAFVILDTLTADELDRLRAWALWDVGLQTQLDAANAYKTVRP